MESSLEQFIEAADAFPVSCGANVDAIFAGIEYTNVLCIVPLSFTAIGLPD